MRNLMKVKKNLQESIGAIGTMDNGENFYQNLRKWSLSKQVLWWDLEKTEEVD